MKHDDGAVVLRPSTGRALLTLALLTFREALADRCVHIAVAIATMMAALTLSVSEVAIFAHERVLIDGALTTMTLAPLLLTMATALVLMERDIGNTSASALLAHPIAPSVWLLGRFLGLWAMMVAQVAAMLIIFAAVFAALGMRARGTCVLAVALIPWECTIALSITMAARCISQRSVAATMAIVVVGAGYFTLEKAELAQAQRSVAWPLMQLAQTILPQMQRINLRGEAAWGTEAPSSFALYAVAYGVGYSGSALLVGVLALKMRRRL